MNHRRVIQLVAALALLAVAVGVWGHWRMVAAGQDALAELARQAQDMERAVNDDTLRRQAEGLRRELARYDSALPAQGEVAGVLEQLSGDLIDLGVTDRSVVTGIGVELGPVRHIPVHVTFQGSFASVHALLERARDYPRLMRIGRLVIRRPAGASPEALSVTLRLDAYSRASEGKP